MKRAQIERLKELFDQAWNVLDQEWSFGEFKARIEADREEADAIWAELLREASE